MDYNSHPFQNLLTNLKPNQKIAIILGIIILISIIMVLPNLFQNNGDIGGNPNESESYTDDQGYTISTRTEINDRGEEVTITTREDPYGNVTTTDPSLITTYFPYQVMREHKEWTSTLRFYLSISQTDKIIYANIEDCDIENDKKLIQDYINSIPIDLSSYSIEYEITSVDTDCGE